MTTYVQPTRRVVLLIAGILVSVLAVLAMAPAGCRLAILLIMGLTLIAVARAKVVTTAEGIHVRNPFRRHFLPWDEVEGVGYERLPELRLHSGQKIRVDGVEPFPQAFPTRTSLAVLDAFRKEVEGHARVPFRDAGLQAGPMVNEPAGTPIAPSRRPEHHASRLSGPAGPPSDTTRPGGRPQLPHGLGSSSTYPSA